MLTWLVLRAFKALQRLTVPHHAAVYLDERVALSWTMPCRARRMRTCSAKGCSTQHSKEGRSPSVLCWNASSLQSRGLLAKAGPHGTIRHFARFAA